MYKQHTVCRACGFGPGSPEPTGKLIKVFSLGQQPLANDFAKDHTCKGWAPLEVLFCPRCTLAQLSVTVDPAVLYADYPYVTSTSKMMHEHFESLYLAIKKESPAQNILEIGSNDGAFLMFLRDKGARVMGIDPAENLGDKARLQGVKTITALWDEDSSMDAANWFFPAVDVIVARHVFCHADDWHSFIKWLTPPSDRNTLVCIEVPYVADLLAGGEFDTIYHEHTSYLTLKAMAALLANTQWHMHHVERFSIHGGAILIMLRRNDSEIQPHPSVQQMMVEERITQQHWVMFAIQSSSKIEALQDIVNKKRLEGLTVAGYGASAKSTVMINACRWTRNDIAFVCDNTQAKQYCYSPGNDIPIVDEGALTRELPDLAVCFSWNYWFEIYQKERVFREAGKRWLVPHPEVKIC